MFFAEVIRELYKEEKVSLDKIKELLKDKKITQEQYDYIVND